MKMNKVESTGESRGAGIGNREPVFTTKGIVMIGVFAAVTAVLAQVSIPTPWGIPITLQTFAVALAGYCLGKYKGMMSVLIYILLGLTGLPVFAGFTGESQSWRVQLADISGAFYLWLLPVAWKIR